MVFVRHKLAAGLALVAALAVLALPGIQPEGSSAQAQDWPMWGYDAAQSGGSPMEIPEELHLHWVRRLPEPARAWPEQYDDVGKLDFDVSYSPVAMGGLVFVPSMRSDHVTAYRIDDGAKVWRAHVDGPVRLAPAAWNGKVYFVSDDGHLHCVEAATGDPLWSFQAAPDTRLVLGNNRLISMWAARGAPVVKDGTVYFAAGAWPMKGTFVYALDAETGEVVWANTGDATNWQRQPHGGAFSFAGISPQGYLAATEDRLVVSGGRSTPALLDRHTGELLFLDVFGKGPGGYRVEADDEFFYNHGRRYRLEDGSSAGSGQVVNEALIRRAIELNDEVDGDVFAALAAHGRVLVTTTAGDLYCYGPEAAGEPRVHDDRADLARAQERARAAAEPANAREAAILSRADAAGQGFALFLGVGDGSLIEKTALLTDVHIVGIDPDAEKIAALRERYDALGLYGKRIGLLAGRAADMKYPPYISSLIVAEDLSGSGLTRQDAHDLLRPYGGTAFVGDTVLEREGPLAGAGQWTHQYADAARSGMSHDERVRLPLGILWYGTESHDNILPRHAAGPRPQVAAGRMVVLGVEVIGARDVYTGRELWVREFPGIGHPFTNLDLEAQWADGRSVYMSNIPGAAYIGSPYATLPDSVYLRHEGTVHRLDTATGETLGQFPLYPEGTEAGASDWGPVIVHEDKLITTTAPHQFDDTDLGWLESWNATSSRRLVVMDRFSGETLWSRDAGIGFRHNAIVAGGGRITVIDGLTSSALEFLARRGAEPEQESKVIALDPADGSEIWSVNSDVFGTYLAYSEEHDILLESGSRDTRRPLPDEPHSRVTARRGSTGETLWSGGAQFPAIIRGDTLIPARPGSFVNLLTGESVRVAHPVTGEEIAGQYRKAYGCGTSTASQNMILFRSGGAGFADLEHNSGTGNFGGFRSGCTANLIPADGVLNAPDYTRTCRCSYQNQTSLGLIHMPDADMWTAYMPGLGRGSVRRLGVNLGAPGGRLSDAGTLWLPAPHSGAPVPDLDALMNTVDFGDAPVSVVGVSASSGSLPGQTLDADPTTRWQVRADRSRRFNESVRYDLSAEVELSRLDVAWSGPEGTEFSIEASVDREEWTTVLEEKGEGPGSELRVYEFDPVRARHVRIRFGEHADESVDSRDRQEMFDAWVSQVRIGGLEFPDAYAYFMPKDVYRKQSHFVDGANGLNWVAASGIKGIRYFELPGVNGNGAPYTVTLHFAEPDGLGEGRRVFDISLQGEEVASGFDAAREAGGADRAVTKTFTGVRVNDSLRIELKQTPGSEHPPMLSGVEIVREG